MASREEIVANLVERLTVYMDLLDKRGSGSLAMEIHRSTDGWKKAHVVLSENFSLESR